MYLATWYSGSAGSRWIRTLLSATAGGGGTTAARDVVVAVNLVGGAAAGGFRTTRGASTGCAA